MKPRITTGKGDKGKTTALSGDTYSKGHIVMECVGALDELRARMALARLLLLKTPTHEATEAASFMLWLLHACVVLGSSCSDPLNRRPDRHPVRLGTAHVKRLEDELAALESRTALPPAFVLSGSGVATAQIDLACTQARLAERVCVRLKEHFVDFDAADILVFLNRLSDYLFLLARHLDAGDCELVDYSTIE